MAFTARDAIGAQLESVRKTLPVFYERSARLMDTLCPPPHKGDPYWQANSWKVRWLLDREQQLFPSESVIIRDIMSAPEFTIRDHQRLDVLIVKYRNSEPDHVNPDRYEDYGD